VADSYKERKMANQEINIDEVRKIVSAYPHERRFALAAMQDMQRNLSYIPREGLELLAEHIGCKVVELYSMATFYKALSLKPRGKHIIKLCNGTACHIRGSISLRDAVCKELGINPGDTTEDGLFTLEMVNCLGACASAPVLMVDETFYGGMTVDRVAEVLNSYKEAEVQ